ncbi:MAG: 3-deoxy-8-phosphooctulonate synthase [Bacteroidales bacterium]|nr:3-deoxy-8-phosphooctulonate synthase [Bacteroidales bacterium]
MIYEQLTSASTFFLIAGPCVVESEEITLYIASQIKSYCEELSIPFIFKASYKKANRTSIESFTTIGEEKALLILKKVKETLNVPVITDIHLPNEAHLAAMYVDYLQIPAFLCRQTDLLIAAGNTGLPVNIKKGQFLSPYNMKFAAKKVEHTGNKQILLTERGTTFGYNDLIVDMRSIPIMKSFGYPVVIDCTHSLQQPNQHSGQTGGLPEMIPIIARAAIAAGADGVFLETHPEPTKALSDGANMLPLWQLKSLLQSLKKIYEATHS